MKKVDFGFKEIPLQDKTKKVQDLFSSIGKKYDFMNNIMSLYCHKFWKTDWILEKLLRLLIHDKLTCNKTKCTQFICNILRFLGKLIY